MTSEDPNVITSRRNGGTPGKVTSLSEGEEWGIDHEGRGGDFRFRNESLLLS